jgi:PAS domain S-box-containing protein
MNAPLAPGRHANEVERLAALDRYDVLDTPRERDFDDIAELASEICGAPIAVVNLIGDGRQFFKAEVGLGVRETPLETSFCGHAILQEDFMLVPDATQDARFTNNPLVAGEPGLRFYAGAILKTEEGLPLGTLCVLDFQPRSLNDQQINTLKRLARQVMSQLELRRALRAKSEGENYLRLILDSTSEAFYSVDCEGNTTLCNKSFLSMLGFSQPGDVIGRKLHDVIHHTHPDSRHYPVSECPIYQCASTGAPAHVDNELFYRADGAGFPVEYWVRPILLGDQLAGAICTFVDITDRRRAELALKDLNGELGGRVAELEAERDRTAMMRREIDHRVMNSLQFVSALLAMQSRTASNTDIAAQMDIAANRVMMVARVHRHFHLDDSVETLCALDYAKRLMSDVLTLLGPVQLSVSGETSPISTTLIMPLGVILNEIVTNAAKCGQRRLQCTLRPWEMACSWSSKTTGRACPRTLILTPERGWACVW